MNAQFCTDSANLTPQSFLLLAERKGFKTGEMSLEDWIALPDHPRQRDTRKQAQSSHWALARRATGAVFEQLRQVAAADLHGTWYKVNGHTRGLLWQTGQLPPPKCVAVTVYTVDSADELNALYTTFDVPSASTTAYDQVFGAYREHNLNIRSKRLRYGAIVDALWIALLGKTRAAKPKDHPDINLYEAVRVFKEELALLDSVNPQPDVFFSGVIAAALIDLSLYPGDLEYFRRLSAKEGETREERMDPVEAILRYLDRVPAKRAKTLQEDLCRRTLRAVTAWREGQQSDSAYWFKNQIQAMNIEPLLEQLHTRKRIDSELYL